MIEEYSTQRILVGPNPPESHEERYEEFIGTKVARLPLPPSDMTGGKSWWDFDFYRTPQKEYVLYAVENLQEGNMKRELGKSGAYFIPLRRLLLTENQARQKYPEILNELIERSNL